MDVSLARVVAGGVLGTPRSALRGTLGETGRCTQVVWELPSGRGLLGIQANTVVRTPYLRPVSSPGHDSACPGVSAWWGNRLPLRSKLCLLFKKRDLAVVQPVRGFPAFNS